MLSPQVLIKGLIQRMLPNAPILDFQENERPIRLGRYAEVEVNSIWPTDHMQADEGALYVATMLPGATALQLGLSATFSATAGAFVLANSDGPLGKRVYPKTLKLAQSVAPTSGTDLRYAIVLDNISRIPTTVSNGTGGVGPGTAATATAYKVPVVCTNMDNNAANPVGLAFFPLSIAAGAAPTLPAPSQAARTIVGNGYIKNSIPVVKDQYVLQFGSCDTGGTFQAAAALAKIVEHVPAVVVGPGQCLVIYLWSTGNITAGNAWDDACLAWTEK